MANNLVVSEGGSMINNPKDIEKVKQEIRNIDKETLDKAIKAVEGGSMREIKFRGKTATVDGQNWVYGHYTRVESFFNDKKKDYIEVIKSNHMQDYAVVENTVGQYTGLKDKNGVEIYEGDILEDPYSDDRATVEWSEEDGMFVLIIDDVQTNFSNEKSTDWEVMGNIYDK